MKRFFLFILLIAVLSVSVFAASDFVGEKEFTLASYNGVLTFTKGGGNINALEESTYWIFDNKDTHNLKYVSFIGQIGYWPNYNITSAGGTVDKLAEKCLADETWNSTFKRFSDAVKSFQDIEMPMGISISLNDYLPDGMSRTNLISKYIPAEKYMLEAYQSDYLDELNSYTIVENNGTSYLVFNLELWPRAAALEWFIEIANAHPDKYIIVFTPSIIDEKGDMYSC